MRGADDQQRSSVHHKCCSLRTSSEGVARHEPLPEPAGGGAFERTGGERDIERPDPDQRDDDDVVGRRAPDQPAGDELGHLAVDPVLSRDGPP